jgi:hypothetical protein
MPFAWGLAGAIVGGSIIVRKDGVDFNLLEPPLLAVAMFIAIPAIGAGLIAWLTELYPRFWWRRRWTTVVASAAAVPAIVFFPLGILAAIMGGAWAVAMLSPGARVLPGSKPVRMAAAVTFVLIPAPALVGLFNDVRAIL